MRPRTIQSGARTARAQPGRASPGSRAPWARLQTPLPARTPCSARYRRIVKRRGHAKALVAVARSILVISWHLINVPDASSQELGADWYRLHLDPARKTRDLVRQLQALGHQVALTPAST
ncbi:hypothetical protein [Streptomyces sannanensis]|uniref:hypothetical protein n=1 Tax=Streptomyces sannanensis TaxID=285536 RepID=UPI0031F0CFBB